MPGRSSKHIRKVDRSPLSDFDDQLWPINVAIVILGGIAAGTIVATSSFDDPRTLHNAWVRLGGVGAVMAVLFCAVVWLQGKMLRRVQLCLIVSLMVHIGLVLYLRDQYLDILATLDREGGQNPSGQRDPITMPDYHWEQIERPDVPQSFEEPVEVETPDHPDEATPEPQPVDPRVQPQDLRVEHKLVEQRQPDPAELRRAEPVMAPRRAEALSGSQLSRQQVDHRLEKTEPQSQPEVKAGEAPQASRLKSHTAEADRRSTAPEQVDLARHAPAEVPRVNAQQSAMRAAKAETAPEAEPAVSQALARRQTAAAGMPTPLESLPDQIAAVADPQHPRTPGQSGAVGRAAAAAPSVRSVAASEAVKEAMAVAPALGQSGLRRSAARENCPLRRLLRLRSNCSERQPDSRSVGGVAAGTADGH